MTDAYLAEVSERDVSGTVAEIYADIRHVLGVPMVNLVYRHLAADDRRLESVWAALRPTLAHPSTHVLAASLAASADEARPHVERVDVSSALRAGVAEPDVVRARTTLAVYERANALNLLAARAIVHGSAGIHDGADVAEPPRTREEILPMADLEVVEEDVLVTLREMSEPVAGEGENVLVPSLYRHLASAPALLRVTWEAACSALSGRALGEAATVVRQRARTLAERLPLEVEPTADPSVRAVFERFEPAMATMLVAGRVVGEALPPVTG